MLRLPRPTVLFLKLLLFTVPTFLLLSSFALYLLYSDRFFDARDEFSTRLGNTVGRTAGALERVLVDQSYDEQTKNYFAQQMLQLLLGDRAIKCATLSRPGIETPDLAAPSSVGCKFSDVDDWLEVDLTTSKKQVLRAGFNTDEVEAILQSQLKNSFFVLACSLLASIASSWFAFRRIVGKPLNALIHDLVLARDAAEHANAAKTRFLANMSHELRTPLNGVLGNVELLRETNLTEYQRERLNTISKSGNVLMAIIMDLLDFAKIDAAHIELKRDEFDLVELIYDTISMIELAAAEKGVELLVDCPTSLQHNFVGDSVRIRQILLNLLNNAVKFTDAGTITLQADCRSREGWSDVTFRVVDTGLGIPRNKLGMIFHPFSQANDTTTREFGGVGLGLTISRELVTLMNGELTAKSKLGVGSEFTCWMPLQNGPVRQEPHEFKNLQKLVKTNPTKVLLVDSQVRYLELASEMLSQLGISCTTSLKADDINPLLDAAAKDGKRYDAVLIDAEMVHATELNLATNIRQVSSVIDTPIILVTPVTKINCRPLAPGELYDAILSKPLKPKALAQTLFKSLTSIQPLLPVEESSRPPLGHNIFEGADLLLVDDHEVNLSVLAGQLKPTGANMRFASDGIQALDACAKQRPDIILMDISMPHMDGFEATENIRRIERENSAQACLIFAVSGNVLDEHRVAAQAAGMDGFIQKPTSREDLISIIAPKWNEFGNIGAFATPRGAESNSSAVLSEINGTSLIDMERFGKLQAVFEASEFEDLLKALITSGDAILEAIKTHIEADNLLEAAGSAHKLKGSSANLGCAAISKAMASLEKKLTGGLNVSPQELASISVVWSSTKTTLLGFFDQSF